VDAAFTFPGEHSDNYRARRDMGGGALLDVGCYLLQGLMASVGPDIPADVRDVHQDMGYSDVDLTTRFRLNAGITEMTGLASISMPASQRLSVRGTEGTAATDQGQAFSTWRESSTLKVNDHVEEFPVVDAYQLMVENVSRCISGGEGWVLPLAETRAVAAIMDSISDAAAD
jgi:predicted dehydrogenase